MKTLTEHWDEIFEKTDEGQLGWYENDFSQTLKFLDMIPDWKNSKIFVPGVGTSGIVDTLSKSNAKLILNDLSSEAIKRLKINSVPKNRISNGYVMIYLKRFPGKLLILILISGLTERYFIF